MMNNPNFWILIAIVASFLLGFIAGERGGYWRGRLYGLYLSLWYERSLPNEMSFEEWLGDPDCQKT